MNLRAFGVESDDFPSIEAVIDFRGVFQKQQGIFWIGFRE